MNSGRLRQEHGRFPIAMPESVYSAILMMWLNIPEKRIKGQPMFVHLCMMLPLATVLAASYAVQLSLASFLLFEDWQPPWASGTQTCSALETDGRLRLIAISLFIFQTTMNTMV